MVIGGVFVVAVDDNVEVAVLVCDTDAEDDAVVEIVDECE